ncbi:MAG: rhodanese-like domain-containing protein [Bacteroidia bacterium]|nr:rhodanese-like domain-containing protein [Bacteroidia bacterium]NNK28882.1 rhodanese-like domain-containing protein [Flavobacteriaceae bacterium]
MKRILLYIFVLQSFAVVSQKSLSDVLNRFNEGSIPYITVAQMSMTLSNTVILDAREREEYNVSHIKDAIYIGYDDFELDSVLHSIKDKDQRIVVYCSIGVRSEDIGEYLKEEGFTNVFNLYGGIFEWKNKGYAVYDTTSSETEKVHAFDKKWGKWLKQGVKVYE